MNEFMTEEEERITNFVVKGIKFDDHKPRPELLHFDFLESVSRVLAFGAIKYSDDNWKRVDNGFRRYGGAALRHIFAAMKGEKVDSETGESHLAHATCCLMFMFYFENQDETNQT